MSSDKEKNGDPAPGTESTTQSDQRPLPARIDFGITEYVTRMEEHKREVETRDKRGDGK